MRNLVILLFLLTLCGSCKQHRLPFYNTADFTPLWPGEQKFQEDTLHRIAAFRFTDQAGKLITNETFQGKIYVANFFFTACPGICPKMTSQLNKVQNFFSHRDDVMLLSHSVMPWADSISQLAGFARLHQIKYPQWRLSTGKQSEIYQLARQSYFAEEVAGYTRDSTSFVHTEHCLLVDKHGHLRGVYNGTLELEIDRMIADIQLLLEEK
jgi:protein SCO1/2